MRPSLKLYTFYALAALLTGAVLAAPCAHAQGLPSGDKHPPLDITADRLDVDQKAGTGVFTGHVHIVYGTMTLDAPRVDVVYTTGKTAKTKGAVTKNNIETQGNNNQVLKSAIATGGVTVTSGPKTATGDKAVYDALAEKVHLTGHVILTQGQSILRGGQLDMDLATQRITVRSLGTGGRVHARLDTTDAHTQNSRSQTAPAAVKEIKHAAKTAPQSKSPTP